MQVPFTLSNESLSVFANGKMHTIRNSHPNYDKVVEHLQQAEHDEHVLEELCNVEIAARNYTSGFDRVEVKYGQVFYDGKPLHNTLTEKMLNLMSLGFDITPWTKFLENLMENPSYRSRESLYDFLEHFNAPITPDGCFIAFKRVRSDFKDIHSGTYDNSPGAVVSMDRSQVDDDNQRTCSAGLHVCADEYLKGYATGYNYRTMVVKVNPRDVVSVPYDYNFSKMRTCQYQVLHEIAAPKVEELLDLEYYADEDWETFSLDEDDLWDEDDGVFF